MQFNPNVERFHKYNIILICGLYGSGKTEFALMNFKEKDRYRISRSELRKLMFEMTNFGETWSSEAFNEEDDVLVKHVERKILEHFLHNKRNVLIINTFMTRKSRQRFVKLARDANKTIGAIFLDTPLEKCIEQSGMRSAHVPPNVIKVLHTRKELPAKSEGFDDVLIVEDFEI